MRLILIVIVVFGLLNSPFSAVFAATYYVSNSGDDDAAGDLSVPWETLQHAADEVSAGDTVKIATGTYAGFRAKSGGSSGSPVVFMADNGASPLVNAVSPDCIKGSIVEIEEFDWWVIDGLEIRNAPQQAGVDVRVADHVTVRNCVCLYNNTVHMPSDGRWALNMINGSTGNSVKNNILIHDGS